MDGANISSEDLLDVTLFVRRHAEARAEEIGEHPTEFELMTAVAFEYFARSGCDIVVCEVGLGGRLDSTNIIEAPEACVIVRIGLDHTDLLGDTPEAIAHEKESATAQLKESGKPENIIEKIVAGKINSWYGEICLVNQPWILDNKTTFGKLFPKATVKRFARWAVGQ